MKICLCCIGRLENRYAIEYVEYYKQLGFDNIFIIDNNYNNEEYFEDVLQSYIDTGFVKIISKYRNKPHIQCEAYIDVYNNYLNNYDWCAFFDFDEYLTLSVDTSIKDYLSRQEFKDYNQICINWKLYTDNNLIYDDGRPCLERFTEPANMNVSLNDEYHDFLENIHIKSIIRGNLSNISCSMPHCFYGESLKNNTCTNNGTHMENISPFVSPINYDLAYIKHFCYKTIEEFLKNKYTKGVGDRNIDDYHKLNPINYFFSVNKKTKEKEDYINNFFLKNRKLKLFVLTHKEITSSKYDPSYMISLRNTQCNNDIDDLNDKCMGETYMIYDVYKNQDKYFNNDTKYVGFCHYRRYFNIDYNSIINLLDNNKIILSENTNFIESIQQQFNECHDITNTDLKIIKIIIEDKYPEYINDFNEFFNQNNMSRYNMFICNRRIFNECCSWIFDIIKEYFKFYNINNYVDMYKFVIEHLYKYPEIYYNPNNGDKSIEYQSRIGGFLSERLLNVFFMHNYKNDIEYINIIVTE